MNAKPLHRTSQTPGWPIPRVLLSVGLALCGAAAPALAQTYTLNEIHPPSGASSSTVSGLNNLGQVVGNTKVKSGRSEAPGRAFVWANGTSVSLPSLGNDAAAEARALSDSGLLIGHSPRMNVYSQPPRAVWWQAAVGGGYSVGDWNDLLPEGSPLVLTDALAISPDGQFVVFDAKNTGTGRYHAAVAQVNGGGITPVSIDTAGNPAMPISESVATDIQHDGTTVRVVGWYSRTDSDVARAFLWQNDLVSGAVTMTDLDDSTRYSFADGVNDSGEVVGNIDVSGVYQAYFWDVSGVKQQLPTLGGSRSYGASINSAGYVTGWSRLGGKNTNPHAFIWNASSGIHDLNKLKASTDTSGIELTSASKINNAGQILAGGLRKSVGVKVLLTPVQ